MAGRLRLVAFVLALAIAGPTRVFAQIDLAGEWTTVPHEDLRIGMGARLLGDYTGLPINEAARLRADTWDASLQSTREHQTIVYPAASWVFPAGGMRISKIVDDLIQREVALKIYKIGGAGSTTRWIWMDGRPHPPEYAAHSWWGFSTGVWEGDMLTVTTTHVKAGWIRANGVPASDRVTLTEHIVRHGNVLTIITLVVDPVYLEEPYISSLSWTFDPGQQLIAPPPSEIVDELPGRPDGFVPHHLPGTNSALHQFADTHKLPFEATRGGKETIYPEYQITLQQLMASLARRGSK